MLLIKFHFLQVNQVFDGFHQLPCFFPLHYIYGAKNNPYVFVTLHLDFCTTIVNLKLLRLCDIYHSTPALNFVLRLLFPFYLVYLVWAHYYSTIWKSSDCLRPLHHCGWPWLGHHSKSTQDPWCVWFRRDWIGCALLWSIGWRPCYSGWLVCLY